MSARPRPRSLDPLSHRPRRRSLLAALLLLLLGVGLAVPEARAGSASALGELWARWYNGRPGDLPVRHFGFLEAARSYLEVGVLGLEPHASEVVRFVRPERVAEPRAELARLERRLPARDRELRQLDRHIAEVAVDRDALARQVAALDARIQQVSGGTGRGNLHETARVWNQRNELKRERSELVRRTDALDAEIERSRASRERLVQLEDEIEGLRAEIDAASRPYLLVSHRPLLLSTVAALLLLVSVAWVLGRAVSRTPARAALALPLFAALLYAFACIHQREFVTAQVPVLGVPLALCLGFVAVCLARIRNTRASAAQRFTKALLHSVAAVLLVGLLLRLAPEAADASGMATPPALGAHTGALVDFVLDAAWMALWAACAVVFSELVANGLGQVVLIGLVTAACSVGFLLYAGNGLGEAGPVVGACVFLAACLTGVDRLVPRPKREA